MKYVYVLNIINAVILFFVFCIWFYYNIIHANIDEVDPISYYIVFSQGDKTFVTLKNSLDWLYCWKKEIKIRLKGKININNINSKRIWYGTIEHKLDISTALWKAHLIVMLFGCCWVNYYCSVSGVSQVHAF